MGALGYNVAAVEHTFIAACLVGLLGGHNIGKQVECLDIAVEETCILCRHQLQNMIRIRLLSGLHGNPEIWFYGGVGEYMISDGSASGELPVDQNLRIIHLAEHGIENVGQLLSRVGNCHPDQCGAVVESV